MIKQTKNELVIDGKRSEEILENILRYRGMSNNKDNTYVDMSKHTEKKRSKTDMVVKEIQPNKRNRRFGSIFAGIAAIAACALIAAGIIYVTHIKDYGNVNVQNSTNSTNEQVRQTEKSSDITSHTQSDKTFYDLTKLEQNNIYSKFAAITQQFSIQEFIDAFDKNQSTADKSLNYYCYMTDEQNTTYNINANIEDDYWQKQLYMEFYTENRQLTSQYTDEDKADKQKVFNGMTFDEVNDIFGDYSLHGVEITSYYNSEGEYNQNITVKYTYYLKRSDGYSVMVVHYDITDQTVTYHYLLNEL